MNAERHERIKEIFYAASERTPPQRAGLLDRACGSDASLRAEVESLLEFHDAPASLPLERGAVEPALPHERLEPGSVFAGRYRVVALLGRGGMGEVYRAHDQKLGVPVALKLLLAAGPATRERLFAEARLARQVVHPAVCRVYDVGEHEGELYLTMELIEGEDLRSQLDRIGRLPPEKVLEIARQLCDGLAAAHAVGVLHRDLKPANVLVDRRGQARLTDFGIAVASHGSETEWLPLGTPAYMAPEQLSPGAELSERTDVYGLGLLLHELLTGFPVFEATTAAELFQQARTARPEPPSLLVPEVDPRLERAILKALEKRPGERPPSARAMAEMLAGEAGAETAVPVRREAVERRPLTLMFIGISGAARLARRLDAEGVREVVRAHRARAAAIATQHGGHVAQHVGDGLLVYFGHPRAREDDPERAVRAGLAVLRGCAELEAGPRSQRPGLHIGVHTGPVIMEPALHGGARQTLAFGEATEIAVRLGALARRDQLLASEATLDLAGDHFDTEPRGLQTFRGITQKIVVFMVRGKGRSGPRRASSRPLVGRDRELGLLLDRCERVAEGMGQVVLITGEPGLGKARLIAALRERLANEGVSWLEARCAAHASASALLPWIELVRDHFGLASNGAGETARARLAQGLEQTGSPASLESPLSSLLSLGPPGAGATGLSILAGREQRIRGLVDWILSLAETRPVVVSFSYAHWSDPSSLEALERLVEELPTARVLLLVSARPGFEPRWAARSHVTRLVLPRLGTVETRRLVVAALAGRELEPAAVDEIVSRADGVPLFAEELLRERLERDRQGAPPSAGAQAVIPARLESLLRARLDRLGAAQRVAELAATTGREFSYPLLAAVSGLPDAELRRALERLVDEELVFQRGEPPEARYTFRHSLIQEAARQSLVRARRRDVHERIARALPEIHPERTRAQPEVIAHHLEEAGRADEAITWWWRAGRRAVLRSANAEALEHLGRTLRLLHARPASPERSRREVDVRLALAAAQASALGFASDALEANLERARALCREVADPAALAPVLIGLARLHIFHADRGAAAELEEQEQRLAGQVQEPELIVQLHTQLAVMALLRGAHERAETHVARVLAGFDPEAHRELSVSFGQDPVATAVAAGAWNDWMAGRFARCHERLLRSVAIAREHGQPASIASAAGFGASLLLLRREPDLAERLAGEGAELAREYGFSMYAALCSAIRGCVTIQRGAHAAGLAEASKGLRAYRRTGASLLAPLFLGCLAEGYTNLGRLRAARAALEEGLQLCAHNVDRFLEADLYRLRAELRLRGEPRDAARAEADLRRALELARAQGAPALELRAATSLARLARQHGGAGDARGLLACACDALEEGAATADVRAARAELAAHA